MEAKQEHPRLKKDALNYITSGDVRRFYHLFKKKESEACQETSSEASCINNHTDCQDFLNYALYHGRIDVLLALLDEGNGAWNLLLPKELFYIYVGSMRGMDMEELHNFDPIFAQFDRMSQKIEELRSRGEEAAVKEANILLSNLQKELINLTHVPFDIENLNGCLARCIDYINNALKTTLAKQRGWKGFLHSLVKYITFGTFHLIGKGEWYHPITESEQVLRDTMHVLIGWKNKTATLEEVKASKNKVAEVRRVFRTVLIQCIRDNKQSKFLNEVTDTYAPTTGKKINLEDEPQDFQDVLNHALAYGRKEVVDYLMKQLPEYSAGSSPLIRRPILISKELFYIYTATQQKLSDADIHSFDKMFEMINIIHHKIIEWKSQKLSPSDGKHDPIEFSVHLIHNMEKSLIKFAHGEQDIDTLKQHCKGFLGGYSQCTFVTEGWGDVLHKLKLTVFGHSKIGANRFALYTPKDIIRETNKAFEQVQCTA